MPTNSLGKSSELKLHCFCLFDAYSMPKDMCSVLILLLFFFILPFMHDTRDDWFKFTFFSPKTAYSLAVISRDL